MKWLLLFTLLLTGIPVHREEIQKRIEEGRAA